MSPRWLGWTLLLVPCVVAACSGDDDASTSAGAGGAAASAATGGPAGSGGADAGVVATVGVGGGANVTVSCEPPAGALPPMALTPVATQLTYPVLAKTAPGDDDRLFVVERLGRVVAVSLATGASSTFLDITARVSSSNSPNDERGLLGLAFHPQYAENGRFFVHYSDAENGGDTRVAEYARSAADPAVAAGDEVATILTVPQPEGNHNGGSIELSPFDGMLFIGLGDGGGAEDQHGTIGNGQATNTLLGKMLRVDVGTTPYTVPAGNLPGPGLPEIWDYGLRNPWRFSFDACTGDLYIGDVGQYDWEEIDIAAAGEGHHNWGWRLMEGNHCFNPTENCDPGGLSPAAAEYPHDGGACSVSGGYVYRGTAIPALRGAYLYGDFCVGRIWWLRWSAGTVTGTGELTEDLDSGGLRVSSFGQDNRGEVYVVHLGSVAGQGAVYRIDPE